MDRYKRSKTNSLYGIWSNMHYRCYKPDREDYKHYGGRGITVCERWFDFENFVDDVYPRPRGLTLDRKDNDSGYSPSNCRWATWCEQQQNTRKRSTNTTGETCVLCRKKDGRYVVALTYNYKKYKIGGSFRDIESAAKARDDLRIKLKSNKSVDLVLNRPARYNSKTGIKNIAYDSKSKIYNVVYNKDGIRTYVGKFKCLEAAKTALTESKNNENKKRD